MSDDSCICNSYDARGWSVCGNPCPLHPPIHTCSGCRERKVSEGSMCFSCTRKKADEVRPESCRQMQLAYHHIIKTFHALEYWLRLENKASTDKAEVSNAINQLRDIWQNKIIPWDLAECDHHLWWEAE